MNDFKNVNAYLGDADKFKEKLNEIRHCDIHNVKYSYYNPCKECEEIRKDKIKQEKLKLDEIEKQNRINKIIDAKINANIPKRYLNSSFDNTLNRNDETNKNKTLLQNYAYDSNIIMAGKTGTGKTHLAISILDKMINDDADKHKDDTRSCHYINYYNIADIKTKDRDLFRKILNSDLLIIDEFGASDNDFKGSLLFEVINERYNNMVYTILISNLDLKNFKENISVAIYSRLKENIRVFEFVGDDYRLTKKM